MKVAFLTEMGFRSPVNRTQPDMRTEFAWMYALQAEHYPLPQYTAVAGFDFVFIIWPKGALSLNAEGLPLTNPNPERLYNQLCASGEIERIVPYLKQKNSKVVYIQEGPGWWWEDYTLQEQIYHARILAESDVIFCHNESDRKYYAHYGKPLFVMNSLIIEEMVKDITPNPQNKVILGGNFCRWYGGMKSFMVSQVFNNWEVWAPSMHNRQPGEEALVRHLPYLSWINWMQTLSTFKVGIHMMPTAAAGTFSLNCAYLGVPVIGNKEVDTQAYCHSQTSVDVDNVVEAMATAERLFTDASFYRECSEAARTKARELFIKEPWLKRMEEILKSI